MHWSPASMFAALFAVPGAGAAPVDFARDVRPILRNHCLECHGPDKQKSGYRLDLRDRALRGGDSGDRAILPHDGKGSPLIRFVSGDDAETQMPPATSGKPRLTAAEVDLLRRWIDEGPSWPDEFADEAVEGPPLWSLTPLTKPAVPPGALNPIDAFIRAKLTERNLPSSPAADARTLVRRLYYGLTGLPPAPEEVDAFTADKDPRAWNSVITRLLASPRYGEHWARHWLDVANYADTHGNDHDYARFNAWPYRDYVIRAFNEDKPYARFVQEQIAGDELFPNDPQATVALGFVAAGPWDHTLMVTVREDTVDHQFSQYLDRDNMVSTVIGTTQSLTVHCARCHDHKFDPITQREYYNLQSVFAGVDRADRPFDAEPDIQEKRRHLLAEKHALEIRDKVLLESPQAAQKVEEWERRYARRAEAWTPFEIVSMVSTGGATLTRQADGSWFASGTRPVKDSYIITARRPAGKLSAVRLEALPDDRLPHQGPGRWENGNFHLSEFRAFAAAPGAEGGAVPLVFSRATADYDEGPAISAAQAIDGNNETQWGVHPRYGEPHEAVFAIKEPAHFSEGTTFTLLLEFQAGAEGHGLGRFRLSACESEPQEVPAPVSADLSVLLRRPAAERTAEQRQDLALAILKLENARAMAALPPPQMVYAITRDFPPDGENFKPSPQPRPVYVLARGEFSRPGELARPGTLACVPGMTPDLSLTNPADESSRRAALARWITGERNVLTWRSIVNRVWAWHFGRGLCDTPSDFGRMGGTPSHPELLDWLAVWFRDEAKGSFKALHRLILTSDTYRQSSLQRAPAGDNFRDSDNRLLWRQNRQRLTGEQIRDTLLSVSGRLDLTMGGPSAIQFNSRGNATFNTGGNPPFVDYENFDQDSPASRRRAIYRFLFRTVPDPLMDALDCPDGGAATPVRGVSTTAVQAFAMLNNRFGIRQCEHIAERARREAPNGTEIAHAFRLLFQRAPTAEELARVTVHVQTHGLANAVHVLVNTNEFLYID